MHEAIIFLTTGFEEIEALTVLDVLRRGGCDAVSVSLAGGEAWVSGSHGITVKADMTYEALCEESHVSTATLLVLPGGPGTAAYHNHAPMLELLKTHHQAGGRIAAICAAPSVLGRLGILEGKTTVCYPSFEAELAGAKIGSKAVEQDGNIITSKGPATALLFALAVLREIKGRDVCKQVRRQMLEPQLRRAYA